MILAVHSIEFKKGGQAQVHFSNAFRFVLQILCEAFVDLVQCINILKILLVASWVVLDWMHTRKIC